MDQSVAIAIVFIVSVFLQPLITKSEISGKDSSPSNYYPTYCVNEIFHALVLKRFPNISVDLIDREIKRLASESSSEYYRAHDLLAYKYFVLTFNPFRRPHCNDVSFEYVPILSFFLAS